jgi:hypothetical protein
MGYSTKQTQLVDGVEVVPRQSPPRRWQNAALDVLALPLVAIAPRRGIQVFGERIPLDYEFRRWYWRTERCVEVALGKHVLRNRDMTNVLEIGNVLSMTGITGQTVVDKYEMGPNVLNVDVLDYEPTRRFDLVLSISTFEHVGHDEHPREPEKAAKALQRIDALADDLLITIPVGYHREFERAFLDGPFDQVDLLVKASRLPRWESRPLSERESIQYAFPYASANGVLVGSRGLTSNHASGHT